MKEPKLTGLKIISLTAENVKKLVAVEIHPDGNMVQITGKNGQGKTSVLDSIWWALAGASHIQAAPIRKGATEARIRLDLGEIVVTRTFRQKGEDEFTSSIAVENADGARFPSPQRMLDGLLGALTFDPLAFDRMDAKAKFEALRKFCPGVDFEAIDGQNRTDYEKRTEVNRRAKEARAAAHAVQVPAGLPEQPVDEAALVDQLQKAGEHNAAIQTKAANRSRMRTEAATNLASIPAHERRIAELQEEIEAQRRFIAAARAAAEDLTTRLDAAPPLPEPIDVAAVRKQLDDAKATNAAFASRARRAEHEKLAAELEAQSKALTEAIEARDQAKREAISKAQMPVPGIEFGDGVVLMNGVPFEQASDAERLRASVAIAMASNPGLRVIRVRDGSLLDDDAMLVVQKMAEEADYQVWIERVDGSGKVGFVLEDGALKTTPAQKKAA